MFNENLSKYLKCLKTSSDSELNEIMKLNFLLLCMNWKTSTDYKNYRFTYYDALRIFKEYTQDYDKQLVCDTGLFIFDDRHHDTIRNTILGGKDLYLVYATTISIDSEFYNLIDSYFLCRGE